MSDFDKLPCDFCKDGLAMRIQGGICDKCHEQGLTRPSPLWSEGETFAAEIDARFQVLYDLIRRQGERIRALEAQKR